jgi:hypothetical protein
MNFKGYPNFKPLDDIKELGISEHKQLIIIEHPEGYYMDKYNTTVLHVRKEDLYETDNRTQGTENTDTPEC